MAINRWSTNHGDQSEFETWRNGQAQHGQIGQRGAAKDQDDNTQSRNDTSGKPDYGPQDGTGPQSCGAEHYRTDHCCTEDGSGQEACCKKDSGQKACSAGDDGPQARRQNGNAARGCQQDQDGIAERHDAAGGNVAQ